MRTNKPLPFDPTREYQPGERAIYRGMVIIAERWTKIKEEIANQPGRIYPVFRCSLCVIGAGECFGGGCNCDEYMREDKKRICFRKLYDLKNKSDEK